MIQKFKADSIYFFLLLIKWTLFRLLAGLKRHRVRYIRM